MSHPKYFIDCGGVTTLAFRVFNLNRILSVLNKCQISLRIVLPSAAVSAVIRISSENVHTWGSDMLTDKKYL